MSRLAISALGPLVVTRDDERLDGFEYNKVRALLVFLAMEGDRPHTRSALADLLWPCLPERSARANLSQALSTLRRALGDKADTDPIVVTDAEGVRLNPLRTIDIDVHRFLGLLRSADGHAHRGWRTCTSCAERLREAVALYRGDFLDPLPIADGEPFEEWAGLKRDHLKQRALGALDHLIEWAEWRGALAVAIGHARHQVALEPFLESGHRALIRLLALNGEPAAALAHAAALRRMLSDELGAEPEAETVRSIEHLSDGAWGVLRRHSAVPFQAPAPALPLVGRVEDLSVVCSLFRQEDARAVTLTGTGGIGKSRMALAIASELRFDFEDGVHVVDLAPLDDPGLVTSTIARALGVRERVDAPLRDALMASLRDRHFLLVLDSAEHLLNPKGHDGDVGSLVADLLAACPDLKVLITSRTPMNVRAERLYPVSPLPLEDAEALFIARAAAVHAPFAPSSANARAIGEICRRLDGLPLAIELLAARARWLSPPELLESLAGGLSAMGEGPRDAPPRHRTMRSAIAWSYDRLSATQKRGFDALAVFAGGGSIEAAEAVLPEPSTSRDVLRALDASGLISLTTVEDEERFRLLDTIRELGMERLAARGDVDYTRRHHAECYLVLAERARPHIAGGPGENEWLDRLERDHDNLRAALAWLRSADAESMLRLAVSLGRFWEVRGYLGEGRRWLADALDGLPDADPRLRGEAMYAAGVLAWRQGDHVVATELELGSLAIWRELEDGFAIAEVLRRLGGIAWDQGDSASARSYYEESLSIARDVDDKRSIAGSLNNLGLVVDGMGDPAAARSYFAESLPLFRELDDAAGIGMTLLNMALASEHDGDVDAARERYSESLATFRSVGHVPGIALVLLNLGNLALLEDDLVAAGAHYREGLDLARALGDRATSSYPLFGLGDVARRQGDHALARSLMRESLSLRYDTDEQRPVARNLEGIAQLERIEGRPEHAARLFGAAASLREAVGSPVMEHYRAEYDREIAMLREALGGATFDLAWAKGVALSPEEAFTLAMEPR